MQHLDLYQNYLPFVYFIFGCIIGSFLNVCIYRLPQGLSVIYPGSRCYYCKKKIPFYYNIPVLAWFLLRGKTACCQQPLPFRYPFVELLTGIFAWLTGTYITLAPVATFTLICLLLVAFYTDIDGLIIPDEITLGGIILGVLLSCKYPELQHVHNSFSAIETSLKNACIAMGALFLFGSFVEYFMKREALGLGDVKLLGCIGAFYGLDACCFAIFGGAIIGSTYFLLIAIYQFIRSKKMPQFLHQEIPFGPFISAATILYVFFSKSLTAFLFNTSF